MADISLLFDVAREGAVGQGSEATIRSQLEQIVASINTTPFKIKFEADTTAMQKQIEDAVGSDSSSKKRQSNAKKTSQAYNEATVAINKYYAKLQKLNQAERNDVVNNNGKWISDSGNYKALADELTHLQTAFDNAKNSMSSMSASEQSQITDLLAEKERAYATEIERRKNKQLEAIAVAAQSGSVLSSSQTALNQATNMLNRYSKAEHSSIQSSKEAVAAIKEKMAAVERARAAVATSSATNEEAARKVRALRVAEQQLRTTLKESEAVIKQNGDAAKTLGERIGGLAKKFTQWFSVSQIIMAIYRTFKKMVSAVREVDTAMTELKKVTDETDSTYDRFLKNAATRAKELGASLSDVITASADFARLGFNISEAEKLADAATVYKNVGDGIEDITTASESIIATMQAFGIEANSVMSIVDKFNAVGNNYAISSKGVGDALLRSAAAMHAAGNDINETIALAAAANTIVQDADKVGTTLKTVSMYLRAAKTEAEDAGESTDGMAGSVSELRGEILALTGNKVDIQIDENNFKSTYQILQELSEVWNDLTDISKANILEMVGGKRNSNVVAALLENFSVAEEAIKTSADSSGSALAENEKYLDSINGKISIFKAKFEELSGTLINSELVKGVVAIGSGIVTALNWVIKSFDELGVALGVVYSLIAISKWKPLVNTLTSIFGFFTKNKVIVNGLAKGMQGLTAAQQASYITTNKLNVAQASQALIAAGVSREKRIEILRNAGLIGSNTTLKKSIKSVTVALSEQVKVLWGQIAAWAASPMGMATITVAAIWGIVKVMDAATESLEESREKLTELKQEATDIKSNLSSLNDELKTTKERILELEGKDSLSFTEKEELDNLKAQNRELQREIDLLELEQKLKNKDINETFVSTMNKDLNSSREFSSGGMWFDEFGNDYGDYYDERQNIDNEFANYKAAQDELSKLKDDYLNKKISKEEFDKEKERLDTKSKNISDYLVKKQKEFNEAAEGIEYISNPTTDDEKAVNEWLDYINDFKDRMAIAMGGKNAKANAIGRLIDTTFSEETEALKELGEQGKVTGETLDDPAYDKFIDKLIELGVITDDSAPSLNFVALLFNKIATASDAAEENTNAFATSLSNIKKLGDGLDGLAEIYEDISNGGDFDLGSLISDDFVADFGDLDSYEEFLKTVANSPDDISACQKAFDKLASEYVQNSDALKNVNDETRDVTIALLEQKGITNATAIVEEQLAINREKNIIQQKLQKEVYEDGSATLDEFIAKLYDEAGATDISRDAYISLIAQETIFNNNKLDVTQKIQALQDLAEQAGLTIQAIAGIDLALSDEETKDSDPDELAKRRKNWADSVGVKIDVVGSTTDKAGRTVEDWVYTFNGKTYDTFDEVANAYYSSLLTNNSKNVIVETESTYTPPDDTDTDSGSETNETAEEKIDNLKHRHEMGLISEETYYKKLEGIRKKYYAGKSKYLDRDRELQEEYHDWEVSNAEDGFEDKVEALQKKYVNGKITYTELKSKLKKLINTTFANDKDTKNKYLDEELPDYLSDAREDKTDKKVNAFNAEVSDLEDRLEMGEITEATYYKKLKGIRDKYKNSTIQDIKDGVKDINEELHDYNVSVAEDTFDTKSENLIQNFIDQKDPNKKRKNNKKGYTFKEFKADYEKLIKDVEKVDKQAAQELKDGKDEVFEDAKEDLINQELDNLESKLDLGEITNDEYIASLEKIGATLKKLGVNIEDFPDIKADIDLEIHTEKVDKALDTFDTESEDLIADYVAGKINYTEFKKKYKALIADVAEIDAEEAAELRTESPDVYRDARTSKMQRVFSDLERNRQYGFFDDEKYIENYFDRTEYYYEEGILSAEEYADNMQDVYENLKDMYSEDAQAKIDALQEQLDAMNEFINKQKELLQDQSDANDYAEKSEEYRKDISALDLEIAELERDTSLRGRQLLAQKRQERAELEKEQSEFENQHILDATLDSFDSIYAKYEEEIKKDIEGIQTTLDSINVNSANTVSILQAWADENGIDVTLITTPYESTWNGQQYASGTSASKAGWSITQERGAEAVAINRAGKFTLLTPDSLVWNDTATKFLYNFANNPSKMMSALMNGSILKPPTAISSTSISVGDVNIYGNGKDITSKDVAYEVLQQFKKLS